MIKYTIVQGISGTWYSFSEEVPEDYMFGGNGTYGATAEEALQNILAMHEKRTKQNAPEKTT